MSNETVKHTPGDWRIEEQEAMCVMLDVVDDSHRCITTVTSEHTSTGEARANATLIASAPTLLEALRTAADAFGRLMFAFSADDNRHKALRELQQGAREVIAKAEGKTS